MLAPRLRCVARARRRPQSRRISPPKIKYAVATALSLGSKEARMSLVHVLYHSQEVGNTEVMAKAVAEGAREAGADVTLANTNEVRFDLDEYCRFDAVAFGTPWWTTSGPDSTNSPLGSGPAGSCSHWCC
jgi:flavorubredoxin